MTRLLIRVRLWLRSTFLRRRLEREMQDEMAGHLERAAARLIARGLTPTAARRAALREFGNVAYLEEKSRDARGGAWVDAIAADARFALRHYARKPGTVLTMFVVLVGGMSISTLLFSAVHAYAVRPPTGIALQPDDVVRIRGSRSAGADGRATRTLAEDELRAYRALVDPFESVAGWTDALLFADAVNDPERRAVEVRATFVTDDYFAVLGVRPALGAGLPTDAAGATTVAVIGDGAWDVLFGRSPDVIGSALTLNGITVTVVGVAPERFQGVTPTSRPQLWMPLSSRSLILPATPAEYRAVARLRAGVTLSEADAAVRAVAGRTLEPSPEPDPTQPSTEVVPLLAGNGDPMFERDVRLLSFSVGLLAVLVLLITCTNVSSLLTGLATARRQEIAVRLSLGAARGRLIRQLLTESALLACVAAGTALLLVSSLLRAAPKLLPALPFEIAVTWPAATFTFGTALGVGVLFGVSPALHATRLALAGALRDSTGTLAAARAKLQRALVVAQIAFTQPLIVMLAAVTLFVLGDLQPTRRTKLGDHIVTLPLRSMSGGLEPAEHERRMRDTVERLEERLAGTPGIQRVVVDGGPGSELGAYAAEPAGRAAKGGTEVVKLTSERASEGHLELLGIPVLRGRSLAAQDASPVARSELPVVIGADLARRLWPDADPVGLRLRAEDEGARPTTLLVIGVMEDPAPARHSAGESYRVFLPADPEWVPTSLLIRTAGPAAPSIPGLLETVRDEASPGIVASARTLAEIEETNGRHFRVVTGALTGAGAVALLLSAIGLYAVVALAVGQRTRDIAVRIAIGAPSRRVGWSFLLDGLRLSGYGLALGLPISLVGLRLLMTVPDVPTVSLSSVTVVVALGVALVATAAAWIPARRAASVDPAITLRSE